MHDQARRRIRYLTDTDSSYESSAVVTGECVDLVMLHVFLSPTAGAARFILVAAGDCSPRRTRIALTKKLLAGESHDFVLPSCGLTLNSVRVFASTDANAIVGSDDDILRVTAVAFANGER